MLEFSLFDTLKGNNHIEGICKEIPEILLHVYSLMKEVTFWSNKIVI